ncbi:hypothetical protein CEK28_18340 [Xenophilus sp. AP218F]|nr:hypothetical protein CEK28_18340 [Xenophilus sp. AP218F]
MLETKAEENQEPRKQPRGFLEELFICLGILAAFSYWVFHVGLWYYEYLHISTDDAEGDWSLLNHIFYMIFSSPLLIIISIFITYTLLEQRKWAAAKVVSVSVIYSVAYFLFLWFKDTHR